MRTTRFPHLILRDLITLTIFGEVRWYSFRKYSGSTRGPRTVSGSQITVRFTWYLLQHSWKS